MPAIMQMMKAGEPLKKYMIDDILAVIVNSPDYEFWIKYANQVLEKHHGGMPRARVFDHALWAAATPDQWQQWEEWIKDTLKDETYEELKQVL